MKQVLRDYIVYSWQCIIENIQIIKKIIKANCDVDVRLGKEYHKIRFIGTSHWYTNSNYILYWSYFKI